MVDKLCEECGVFGIFDAEDDASHKAFFGLIALQHRGQESCGIAVNKDRVISYHKGEGLVNDVFDEQILGRLRGNMAIGHVRYSTAGGGGPVNAQPLVLNYIKGNLGIAHNGNIVNSEPLKKEYERTGAIYQTTSDTEIIAYTIARERIHSGSIEQAVSNSMERLKGAFSLVVMSPQKLIAARDPWGFRPLCMGRLENGAVVFASETCALDALGAEFVRDIEPGEIVVADENGVRSLREHCGRPSSLCVFEYIYFARPDSMVEGQFVYDARKNAGACLARQRPVEADAVVGVPDSGLGAGMGYAEESGIPYIEGFMKNRYISRTFIRPSQSMREMAVRLKLNPIRQYIAGKRIVLVDDSIVRGTTCGRIVRLLREADAKEVHVRISAPQFLHRCYFGIDIPTDDELISNRQSVEEIRKFIGADSLEFLAIENLRKIAPCAHTGFCEGCFTGRYPVEIAGNS